MVTSLSVTFPVERHAQLRLTMPTARRLAIVLLVFLPFVGEMLYGLSLYLGIEAPSGARIIRAGVSAAGLAVLLWRPLRPLSLYIWALCGLWLILFCFWAGTSRFMDLIAEVAVFAKLLYGFFLLALVYPLASRESNAEFLKFTLRALTTSISSLVILSFITGVGLETYGDYTFGTKSFFEAGNGLGFLLVSGFAITCEKILKRFSFTTLMAALLHFFACVFLGTTTSILGAFLVIGVYFLAYIFFHPSRTGTRFMMKALLIVIVGGGITYAGIKTYHFVTEFPFMVEKAERIWKEGPRARRLENAFAHFSERPVLTLLIGEGMYSFSQNYARADAVVGYNPEVMPLTEVDPVDLYGSYGLPFTIATYAPYLLWLAFSVKIWRNTRGRHTLSEIFILTLGLTISIVAGHVIFQPTALTALAIVAATVLLNRERVRVRGGKYA